MTAEYSKVMNDKKISVPIFLKLRRMFFQANSFATAFVFLAFLATAMKVKVISLYRQPSQIEMKTL